MRLWHYKLIPVLPDKMLVSQWRECIAIKRQWEKGTLKHRLVSYVMDYDSRYFLNYVESVMNEMWERKIKVNDKYWKELLAFFLDDDLMFDSRMYIKKTEHYKEHNDRYLKQCYYNLQEKADRGIITKEEWKKIDKKMDYWNKFKPTFYHTKKVLQYKNNKFVNEYESVAEVQRKKGYSKAHISEVCNGKRTSAYGCVWKFKEED